MEDNTIYVGRKPISSYLFGILTQIKQEQKEIILKARGKMISKAVDIAEVCINRLATEFKVKDIKIGTDERIARDESGKEKPLNVSTIEITLEKSHV